VIKVKITFFGFRVLKKQEAFFNNLLMDQTGWAS